MELKTHVPQTDLCFFKNPGRNTWESRGRRLGSSTTTPRRHRGQVRFRRTSSPHALCRQAVEAAAAAPGHEECVACARQLPSLPAGTRRCSEARFPAALRVRSTMRRLGSVQRKMPCVFVTEVKEEPSTKREHQVAEAAARSPPRRGLCVCPGSGRALGRVGATLWAGAFLQVSLARCGVGSCDRSSRSLWLLCGWQGSNSAREFFWSGDSHLPSRAIGQLTS